MSLLIFVFENFHKNFTCVCMFIIYVYAGEREGGGNDKVL